MNKRNLEILGLGEDATREQIEEAYSALRAKYLEDRFLDGEAGNNAARMLNKIEAAKNELLAELAEAESSEENGGGEQVLLNYFAPFMQKVKTCKNGYGCFPNVTYKNIDGTNYVNWNILSGRSAMILNDGTMIMFNASSAKDYSKYGQIYVDINGAKPPNQVGVDFFYFYLFDNAIVPAGAPRYYGDEFFMEKCVKDAGFGCAAWVIYNENMDYLHCSDLGWNGRKRCPKKK